MRKTFAKLLTKHMELSGITIDDLAKEIGKIGVERSTILRWRTGQTKKPRRRQDVLDCAKCLKLTPEETDELLMAAGYRSEYGTPQSSEPPAGEQPTPPLRSNLPYRYTDLFVGRDHELTVVLGPWLSPERRVRAIAITASCSANGTATSAACPRMCRLFADPFTQTLCSGQR
mgnify:CR=1 FL=1